ncbi:MAG: exosome complex RNA-binding protein Csl4 [Halobacteria archaeon]
MAESKTVLPGDFLGTSEEFMPGPGTCDEDGKIYAVARGTLNVNTQERVVSVLAPNAPPEIKEGTVVYGRVNDARGTFVLLEVACVQGQETRAVPKLENALIHVSNIRDSYVEYADREFAYMDIVRAKIIDAKALKLGTAGKNLGVVKAYCSSCRVAMVKKGENRVECPLCLRTESRKLADDYGRGLPA